MRWLLFYCFLPLFTLCGHAVGQTSGAAGWLARVSETQARQPHWITPLVLVTPRLEQEFRTDFVRQQLPAGQHSWNYGNGKGLELIPASRIELLLNLSPYIRHSQTNIPDGLGDVSFAMKFRILAANEQKGNYILTAFLGGSIPTGTHTNGTRSATLTPTLSGGKGWGRFNVQSSLGGVLPVDSIQQVGRTIVWNTVAQGHLGKYLWPELETNGSFFQGGPHDGRQQVFLTPGLVAGRIPIHNRIGLTIGAGMQIAASHYHAYDHALVLTARLPF